MMPATNRALDAAGASVIMPAKYLKREVIKGALGPVGRFGSPAPTRANASTLHLFGAGLSSFADWQVLVLHMRSFSSARNRSSLEKRAVRSCSPRCQDGGCALW